MGATGLSDPCCSVRSYFVDVAIYSTFTNGSDERVYTIRKVGRQQADVEPSARG